jgi:O-antigen ligase
MPEYLRALLVIFVLATTFFSFAHKPACTIMADVDFTRRRNLWLTLTLAAFLSHNFWLYTLIAIPLLIRANRHEENPIPLYFFVLFALPVDEIIVPGLGLINYVSTFSHPRMLALIILLPALYSIKRKGDYISFGRTGPDILLAFYILLTLILSFSFTNITDSMRKVFYIWIDVFIPYLVISRSLKNMDAFRDALLSLVLAIMLLALLGAFEIFWHWLLYTDVVRVLGLGEGEVGTLGRDGMLRALATTGQPIALGFLMIIGIGIYMYLQHSIQSKLVRRLGMVLLAAGSFASLSRGPWVGTAVLVMVFIATGRNAIRRLISILLSAVLALPLIAMVPGGERMINLLPFIGSTEEGNIGYREKLITNSMIVIQRNPWFGSDDFLKTPEMEEMRQGQGIIDIVNSYLLIILQTGFVGLGLFLGFFVLVLLGIYRAMRSISDIASDEYLLGRALMATLIGLLVTISTVSSISFIPIMYWSVAGLGVAYTQMLRK